MSAEVKIQLRGSCPADGDNQQFRDAVNFVASTIERVMAGTNAETNVFDPSTGEPYNPVVFDQAIVRSIHAVSVASPASMVAVLEKNFTPPMDWGIEVAPIFFDTADL